MNKLNLIDRLTDDDEEEEVFIEIDGQLYDFSCKHISEQFDGFETAYPACVALKIKEQ